MIVAVGETRFRGADVTVAFRELWWSAKGTDIYSDERGQFIVNAMQSMATAVTDAVPGAEPEKVDHAVETFMRRVETDGLNTPDHLLALGGLLGRYVLSDESSRDMQALNQTREGLCLAWRASGLDQGVLQAGV